MTLPEALLLAAAALAASTVSAVAGFGGAAIFLPVITAVCGAQRAVPMVAVAQLVGNASRAWLNRREADWRVVGWFAVGAVPASVAGALLFSRLSGPRLTRILGAFLLFMVAWRRLGKGARAVPRPAFAGLGAVFAFLSAIVASVGPVMAPFFLAAGLAKASYIGTDAGATVVMRIVQVAVYRKTDLLAADALLTGLALGPVMLLGSWLGKKLVDRVSERTFAALVEIGLVGSGIAFLVRG